MPANPVIQYGVDFVVGISTPKNAIKVLTSASKATGLINAGLGQYLKSIKHLTPALSGMLKVHSAWKDVLFPIGLVNKALNLMTRNIRLVTNVMTTELVSFLPQLTAALNPAAAVAAIDLLKPMLVPIVQQTARLGETWESVTNLVVDGAASVGVMATEYATLAIEVSRFHKSAEMIRAVTDNTLALGQATGLVPADVAALTAQTAKLASSTRLVGKEVQNYTESLVGLTNQLPTTVDYLNQFVQGNSALIRSNQLSVPELTAYGATFEQLGISSQGATTAFGKLVNILQAPEELAKRGATGLAELGYTVEDIQQLVKGENGLNGALTELLTRIQGIANTDPSAAVNALISLLGADPPGSNAAQELLALSNNLGLVDQALKITSDTAGNNQLTEELLDIADQADPVANLADAFANLSNVWGTIIEPLVLSISQQLANIVTWISETLAVSRDAVRTVVGAVVNVSRAMDNLLGFISPVIKAWTNYILVTATVKLVSIAAHKAALLLASKGLFAIAGWAELAAVYLDKLHVFMATKLIPTLLATTKASLIALPGKAWAAFLSLIHAIPGALAAAGAGIVKFGQAAILMAKTTYATLAPILPYIAALALAFLTVRAAVRTWKAVTGQANEIRDSIAELEETGDRAVDALNQIGIEADGSLNKVNTLWENVVEGANNAMEAIRDNLSVFEHLGKLIGNSRLESFKFATQAEATANQSRIAYADLLEQVDSYGASYQQLVAKLRANPQDPQTLKAAEAMLELLRKQKVTLQDLEVAKEDEASKAVYVKSLDQQIRYVSKLIVGNDALKNSLDQAEVSVENMAEALDNLRSAVADEVSKAGKQEIEQLQAASAKREEGYKKQLDATKQVAQAQYDEREKAITREQQLEDRARDRQRQLEDRAIDDALSSQEQAIEQRHAAEDRAIEASQQAQDKAIASREAAEDRAIEKRYKAEDQARDKRYAAEDKAIEAKYAAEDRAIANREATEDRARERRYAAEDAAREKQHEAQLTAIQSQADAAIQAIEDEVALRIEAVEATRDLELEQIEQRLQAELTAYDELAKVREEQLATELAKREEIARVKSEKDIANTEAQQLKLLQQLEEQFNEQQRQRDEAYERNKLALELKHQSKLQQLDAAAQSKLQQIQQRFNTQEQDKQLKAVEQRKNAELARISEQEAEELKRLAREEALANAESPEERARIEAELRASDEAEQRKQAIADKYEQQRQAAEAKAQAEQQALEAEKAKKEEEAAKARAKAEEEAAKARAAEEAKQKEELEALALKKEQEAQARQQAFEEQQAALKLEQETKLNELKQQAELALNELRQANEAKLEELRQQAEEHRSQLRLQAEAEAEQKRLQAEEAITQLRLRAEEQIEQKRLDTEEKIEAIKAKYERERADREEKREVEKAKREEQREVDKAKREEKRENDKAKREEQREKEKEQREEQREAEKTKREEARENDKAKREEQREREKEQREATREEAKKTRERQAEDEAYQRQLQREDEDYERQLEREEQTNERRKQYELEQQQREEQYEKDKAARELALAEEVAAKEAELAKQLETIKLQTQESIEQSYAQITAGLKDSAKAIADAAQAANAAASAGVSSSGKTGKRYKGGRVAKGMPYWVGENRLTGALTPNSELFIPSQAGYVASAAQVWHMVKAANRLAAMPPVPRTLPTAPSLNKQLAPLTRELQAINKKVATLTATVNPRTNELRTKQPTVPPTLYKL